MIFIRRWICLTACVAPLALTAAQGAVKERLYEFDDPGAVAGTQPAIIASFNRRGTQDTAPSTTDYGGVDPPNNENNSFVAMIGSGNPDRIPFYVDASDRPGATAGNLGMEFDGVNDSLYVARPPSSATTPYPFDPREFNGRFEILSQAWVKPTATSYPTEQFVWRIGEEHGAAVITTNGKWALRTANFADPGEDFEVESDVSVVPNEWTHVFIFRGGNISFLYVNGALVASDPGFWGFEGPDMRLGSDQLAGAGTYFQGMVDNFSVGTLSDGSFDPVLDIDYYSDAGLTFSGVDGDVDQDGTVDVSDYDIWSQNFGFNNGFGFGDPTTLLNGDVDGSGIIDLFDFQIIQREALAAGTLTADGWVLPVPEPSALMLAAGTLMVLGGGARFRHSSWTNRLVTICLVLFSIVASRPAHAELVVAEDFLYDGPVKTLRIGGDFNGYQRYQGGQNGPAGAWGSRWASQSDGAIVTTLDQYTAPGDPPNPLDVPPEHVGMLEGDAFAANTLIMRNFALDDSVPLDQTLYFGGRFKADLDIDPAPQFYSPRLYLNWIRGADRTSSGIIRDGSEDIAIGYEENNLVVRLGNILPNPQDPEATESNFGFEAMQTVDASPPDDGQWHLIIGKLELNVDGGTNERLTAWIDPTGVETGGTSLQLERDMLADLSELLGTFDAQATNYVPEDELDPERGRTYIDDIAMGTAWEDVVDVAVPRLTLRINPETGVGRLINLSNADFDLDGYSIESEAGSLNEAGWNSLDDQNQSNWMENEATSSQLVETDFLGATTIAAGGQLALGNLFNTTGPTAQDVVGRYSTQDGLINLLNVEYSTAGLAGDFDNDGDVDGHDFLLWQRNPSVGDLADWQTNYGTGSAVAATVAVPEPGTCLLLVCALMGWMGGLARWTIQAAS